MSTALQIGTCLCGPCLAGKRSIGDALVQRVLGIGSIVLGHNEKERFTKKGSEGVEGSWETGEGRFSKRPSPVPHGSSLYRAHRATGAFAGVGVVGQVFIG